MDVTINLNLTPAEARQLVGLPDVQRLQDAALAKMQDRVMAQAETFSADGLLDAWFGGRQMPQWMRFATSSAEPCPRASQEAWRPQRGRNPVETR
jgi:hypothetical protein